LLFIVRSKTPAVPKTDNFPLRKNDPEKSITYRFKQERKSN